MIKPLEAPAASFIHAVQPSKRGGSDKLSGAMQPGRGLSDPSAVREDRLCSSMDGISMKAVKHSRSFLFMCMDDTLQSTLSMSPVKYY